MLEGLSDTSNESIAYIRLEEYEECTISKKKKPIYRDLPYIKVGSGEESRRGKSMNVIKLMSEMSKPELWLVNLLTEKALKNAWDEGANNIAIIKSSSLTPVERKNLSNAYKKLNEKDIVRRIRREMYIINPKFMIPRMGHDKAYATWTADEKL